MKRTLMMLVAVLTMTAVASVQAADVKVNLLDRGADQQLVPAQNVKYSIANAEGEIVADGAVSAIALDLPEGSYEITVEQTVEEGQARYGSAAMTVAPEGAEFAYEITAAGLVAVKGENGEDANGNALVIRKSPVSKSSVASPMYPQLPQQANAGASMNAGRNWGVLGLAGALVATAIALGVDDDEPARDVTPVQR